MAVFKQRSKCGPLHKILSSILLKPWPTKPFFDSLSRTFFAKLDESTSKFSTEGCRIVIFHKKWKQFAKIDAKLVTVGMLRVYSMNIIVNKCTHSLFIVTLWYSEKARVYLYLIELSCHCDSMVCEGMQCSIQRILLSREQEQNAKGNQSMETEVQKPNYGSEKKAAYWCLMPDWLMPYRHCAL